MLEVRNIQTYYGNIQALKNVSLTINEGEIVTLIGANGAGKSTTLNSIVGLVKADGGSVSWNGKEILGSPTKNIVESGIVLVPEGRRVFPNLTVDENLSLGAYARSNKDEVEADRERVFGLFPRLKERHKQKAGTFSGGEQQMLAVARALMSKPKVMMMDEPSLGLAPLIVGMIFDIIRQINAAGVTVLLVEQNAKAALEVANTGYVMETAAITFHGPGKELLRADRVRKAYVGEA